MSIGTRMRTPYLCQIPAAIQREGRCQRVGCPGPGWFFL